MSIFSADTSSKTPTDNRRIRVFISSTFLDMADEREALMAHTWPELRRFCSKRHVELVEVDLRWGISEGQSKRKETLKRCLDEIHACRPFFIGLLGERYGWVPGGDSFSEDLNEEQPWLTELEGKSVTELEIMHGVLNNPEMAGRAFFYFRDPEYSKSRGRKFFAEDPVAAEKQDELKRRIRKAKEDGQVELEEDYRDPASLSQLVLEQLEAAVDAVFPKHDIPDSLAREAYGHESFAEIRKRTYIGREEYYQALDDNVGGDGSPLVVLGDSGCGKSALLANWVERWHENNPQDYIFQHYIGGTPDSVDHWLFIQRLMAEIKKWCDDPEDLPTSRIDMARDFQLWLSKARLKAERDSVRFIIVLDALNQLADQDRCGSLNWLPADAFLGPLRLVVSTLPGEAQQVIEHLGWDKLQVEKFTEDEQRHMIVEYLKRFGKKLDPDRIDRIVGVPATSSPLFLKILLDELRVTGTHDQLDDRLGVYLAEPDIPSLLKNVLNRFQNHYEADRDGLVKDALGLMWSARRGLSESEILKLLRPEGLPQLPPSLWVPLRAAMEEMLVDCGGILNFSHGYLRTAVQEIFISAPGACDGFRLKLADYFESMPASPRSCDELPWLLKQTGSDRRLRNCLLDIDCFLEIQTRDENELRSYWVGLGEETSMGGAYLESFERWTGGTDSIDVRMSSAAYMLSYFFIGIALYAEAELLLRKVIKFDEETLGPNHPGFAKDLNSLAEVMRTTNRIKEAEALFRRALSVLEISLGEDHQDVARTLSNLALLLNLTNRMAEAEPLFRRALNIDEKFFGPDHPNVATSLNNLAGLLWDTHRLVEAESLARRALNIYEKHFGNEHPSVAACLSLTAQLLVSTGRIDEAERQMRRALSIDEQCLGNNNPNVAISLNNLAGLLSDTGQMGEAESLYRRALAICEKSLGKYHPDIAPYLNNFAQLLQNTNRIKEAEPLMRQHLEIFVEFTRKTGHQHPHLQSAVGNYGYLLLQMGCSREQIATKLREVIPEIFK